MTARPDIDAVEGRAGSAANRPLWTWELPGDDGSDVVRLLRDDVPSLIAYVRGLEATVASMTEQHELDCTSFYDVAAQRDALRARGERFTVAMRHARRLLDEALADEPVLAGKGET